MVNSLQQRLSFIERSYNSNLVQYPNLYGPTDITELWTVENGYTCTSDGWIYLNRKHDGGYMCLFANYSLLGVGGGSGYDQTSFFIPVKSGWNLYLQDGAEYNSSKPHQAPSYALFYTNL